ncbi:SGNH/GDSL hydrolase family protein [Nanoarchaeota archaeon]
MKLMLLILVLLLLCGCTALEVENETQQIIVETEEQSKEEPEAPAEKFQQTIKENETVPIEPVISENVSQEIKNITENITEQTIEEIIAIGDSLTYGESLENENNCWISLYSNQTKLHNYAVSGATTFGARYSQLLEFKKEPVGSKRLVFMWIGANDAASFISLPNFEDNYRAIVNEILDMENTTLILINIPDASKLSVAETVQTQVDEYLSQYGVQTNIEVKTVTKDVLAQYNSVIKSIADENNLTLIDMFGFLETFDNSMISADLFHPNEKGHRLIAEKIREEVKI